MEVFIKLSTRKTTFHYKIYILEIAKMFTIKSTMRGMNGICCSHI